MSSSPVRDAKNNIVGSISIVRDITDLKRTEQMLRKSEAELAEAQRIAMLGSWTYDLSTQSVKWSDELYRICELKKDDFEESYDFFIDCIHPDDKARVMENNQRTIKSGKPFEHEYRIVTKKNEIKYIRSVGYAQKDRSGAVSGLFGTAQEITKSKRAENALKHSEEQRLRLVNTIPDVVVHADLNGTVLFINDYGLRLSGYTREEIEGKSIFDFMLPACRDKAIQNFLKLIKEDVGPEEYPLIKKSGEAIFFEISGSALKNIDGTPYGFVGICHDLSFRKQAEEALRESEIKYRTIFETASDTIFLMDRDVLIDCNSQTLKMFGCTREQIIGQTPYRFSPDIQPDGINSREKSLEKINAAINGQPQHFEWTHLRYDGKPIDTEINLNAVSYGGKHYIYAICRDITERKRVEQALREREETFRILAESSPTAVMLYQNNKWIYANSAATEISGYSVQELQSMNFWDIVHPDDKEMVRERGQKRQKGEDAENRYVFKIITRNGTVKWVDLSGASAVISGKPAGIISVLDITDRKLAEEALKKSEANFRLLAENAPDAIFIRVKDKFAYVNNAALKLFGAESPDQLIGQSVMDRIHPDIKEEVRKRMRLLNEKKIVNPIIEHKYLKLDGTSIDVEVSAVPFNYEDQDGALVFIRDITERKKSQEMLLLIKKAVEDSSDAIGIADAHGRHFYHNKAFTELLGYTAEELNVLGVGPAIYADKNQAREVFDTIMSGGSWKGEVEDITKDGHHLTVLLRADAIKDDTGKIIGLLAINTDITERRKAEEEIIRLNETLEQRVNERTAELEAFSYSVSHDLRAPLRTIDGFSQALVEDFEDKFDTQGKDYIFRIRRATENMSGLIEDLLKLSRITRSEMDILPVNLSGIVSAIVDELKKAGPHRKVDIKIAEDLDDMADPRLIRIVLENLIGNAWKFTEKKENAEIEFGSAIENDKIIYFIRDNGAGFDEEYAGKLFAPFQRLHSAEEFPGTGIGLATVRRIINRHGGKVWAEGAIDKGATIYFTLH